MQRRLSPEEILYVGQRSRAVISCSFRGAVDEKLLAAAFAAKLAEHAPLRSRIARDEAGFFLEPLAASERPALVVRDAGPGAYLEEQSRPLPVGGPLSRAVLLHDPGTRTGTLVLVVDHTIVDGHSAIALYNALWQTYIAMTQDPDGAPAAPDRTVWPVPIIESLPPSDAEETGRYLARRMAETEGRLISLLPYEAALRAGAPGAVPGDGAPAAGSADARPQVAVKRVELDAAHTADLRRFAKASGVSVHGLIAATVLITARRHLPGTGPRTLGCLSPVDLRTRLTPPLDREVMVPAVTIHSDRLEVDENADPVELARHVTGNLREAVARGDHYQEIRITPKIPEHPTLLAGTVIVTNMGPVAGPPAPAGVEITDMRLVPAREHYFPEAGRGPLMACVVSFDGRLGIELPYSVLCFTDEQVESLRQGIQDGLLALADRAGTAVR